NRPIPPHVTPRLPRRREPDVHAVGERNGLQNRAQLVLIVRAPPEHAQVEIDLGEGQKARTARAAHLSYCSSENTSYPASLLRPLRNVSSTTTPTPATLPPTFSTSLVTAAAVPPVASRSSTMRTLCPLLIASL